MRNASDSIAIKPEFEQILIWITSKIENKCFVLQIQCNFGFDQIAFKG